MSGKRVGWRGSFTAIVNPFTQAGALDEKLLRANINLAIAEGVHGLVINGHNGEVHLMEEAERDRVLDIAMQEIAGRVPVVAGAGGIATAEVIARTRKASAAGVQGVMIEPPYFMCPKPADLHAHFARISDAVDLPIMIYNVPHRAGTDVTVDILEKLLASANIAAIKDSANSYQRMMEMLARVGDRIAVFVGPAGVWGFPGILMGAVGYVDGMQQVAGRAATELYEFAMAGDVARGVPLQHRLYGLRTLIFESPSTAPSTLKDAMRLMGRPGGYPRPPLRPLAGAELERFAARLGELGFLREKAAAE